MTRSGTAFPLLPLAPLTAATGSGLWPTPVAHDDGKTPEAHLAMKARMKGGPRKTITSLNVMVKAVERGLWPTPNAADGKGGRRTKDEDLLTGKRASGAKVQVSLRDAVRRDELWPTPSVKGNYNRKGLSAKSGDGLATAVNNWPTPTARLGQARGAQPKRYLDPERSNDLDDAVAFAESFKTPTAAPFSHGGSGGELHKQVAPSGGPLNPQWVAWLMGFPIDWTSLPPSETRSSRRSRNGSGRASSTGKAA